MTPPRLGTSKTTAVIRSLLAWNWLQRPQPGSAGLTAKPAGRKAPAQPPLIVAPPPEVKPVVQEAALSSEARREENALFTMFTDQALYHPVLGEAGIAWARFQSSANPLKAEINTYLESRLGKKAEELGDDRYLLYVVLPLLQQEPKFASSSLLLDLQGVYEDLIKMGIGQQHQVIEAKIKAAQDKAAEIWAELLERPDDDVDKEVILTALAQAGVNIQKFTPETILDKLPQMFAKLPDLQATQVGPQLINLRSEVVQEVAPLQERIKAFHQRLEGVSKPQQASAPKAEKRSAQAGPAASADEIRAIFLEAAANVYYDFLRNEAVDARARARVRTMVQREFGVRPELLTPEQILDELPALLAEDEHLSGTLLTSNLLLIELQYDEARGQIVPKAEDPEGLAELFSQTRMGTDPILLTNRVEGLFWEPAEQAEKTEPVLLTSDMIKRGFEWIPAESSLPPLDRKPIGPYAQKASRREDGAYSLGRGQVPVGRVRPFFRGAKIRLKDVLGIGPDATVKAIVAEIGKTWVELMDGDSFVIKKRMGQLYGQWAKATSREGLPQVVGTTKPNDLRAFIRFLAGDKKIANDGLNKSRDELADKSLTAQKLIALEKRLPMPIARRKRQTAARPPEPYYSPAITQQVAQAWVTFQRQANGERPFVEAVVMSRHDITDPKAITPQMLIETLRTLPCEGVLCTTPVFSLVRTVNQALQAAA